MRVLYSVDTVYVHLEMHLEMQLQKNSSFRTIHPTNVLTFLLLLKCYIKNLLEPTTV